MANVLNGKGGFLGKAAVSALAAGGIDAAVEVGRLPVLNDESNLFPGRSNTEVVLYGAGVIGTVLSAFAMFSKSRLFGNVGADLLPASIGALAGTYAYENFVAPAVIRK